MIKFTKVCTVCKESLPLNLFYNSKQTKDGKGYRCKNCERVVVREYKQRYHEKTKYLQRSRNRLSRYGISPEEFSKMRIDQNDQCKICKVQMDFSIPAIPKIRPTVDHCHSTGKVRGILCTRCNQALGLFDDNIENLKEGIAYLTDIH